MGQSGPKGPTEKESQISNIETIRDDRREISKDDRSILIIEDDPGFARILRDMAREKGFRVIVAGDGETGLHFADYYRPDAVVLDIGLPGMDGWGVMSRLKENLEFRHIPVHFISAFEDNFEAMKMGAIGYLTKPVSAECLDQVFDRIEHVISRPVKRLLIIEDDQAQTKIIEKIIGNGDVSLTVVSTGREGYERLKSENFDCVILDLGLPDITEQEFLNKIRDDKDLAWIPVIVYTAKYLSEKERATIDHYAEKIMIKEVKSPARLLDETALFLHRGEANLPQQKREILRKIYDKEALFKGKKILMVDDDMRNVFALTSVLEGKEMDVLVGRDGREGLVHLNDNPDVDLVLMDMMMPEMDGY